MNQRIVVLCGPDMCGKTEISRALSNVLGIPCFKASSEHQTFLSKQEMFVNQLRYADTRMVDFLEQTGHSVIFDRAWPCERAYSDFYRRPTDESALRFVDSTMARLDARIVVCFRSHYDGIVDDLDDKLRGHQLAEIEHHYRQFAEWTRCRVHFLNVDDENLDRELTEILGFLGYTDEQVQTMMERQR